MDLQNTLGHGLGVLHILQLNTRKLVNIERRSNFINEVINSDYSVLRFFETG